MGYFQVEKFQKISDWTKGIPTSDFNLVEVDWPSALSSPEKVTGFRLQFNNDLFVENYFEKSLGQNINFVATDGMGMTVNFEELVLTLRTKSTSARKRYSKVEDFNITFSIWEGNVVLREWFVPLVESESYIQYKFDLKPLIDAGFTRFNKIRFGTIKSDIEMSVYFGDLFLFQDDVEHNIRVAIADSLHLRKHKKVSALKKAIKAGDDKIDLTSYVDIHEGNPILIGDPNGDFELHVIANAPIKGGSIKFTGLYGGNKILADWPVGTPVYETYVSEYGDLSSAEEVFSVFYVHAKAPEPEEMRSDITTRFDSYVRDPFGNHSVATRKSIDNSSVQVEIHVYSRTIEKATEMWRYLRSVYDEQSFIDVGGESVQYDILRYENTSDAVDFTEESPHYVMEMVCYVWENVHQRQYTKFPYFKSLDTNVEAIPLSNVSITKTV